MAEAPAAPPLKTRERGMTGVDKQGSLSHASVLFDFKEAKRKTRGGTAALAAITGTTRTERQEAHVPATQLALGGLTELLGALSQTSVLNRLRTAYRRQCRARGAQLPVLAIDRRCSTCSVPTSATE